MEDRQNRRPPRTEQFLNTVPFGSLLVFASVMPPLTPENERAASIAPAGSRPEAPSRNDASASIAGDVAA